MRKFGGTWSESKLDCVENYARSYLRVMQKQDRWTLDYVDAFAGSGKQALKSGTGPVDVDAFFGDESERNDTRRFLAGSAIRALRASDGSVRPFDRFLFIDADQASCDELQSEVDSDFPALKNKVEIKCDDANNALGAYLESVDWNRTRALVLLDPYGLEVDWDLVMRLAGTGACDVWYLFPLGGVLRMMATHGRIPDSWAGRLDRLFGSHDWYEEFYMPSPQQTLFDTKTEDVERHASTRHVVEYICKRLGSVFAAVSNAAVLRNSKGAPLFALVLGVSNPRLTAQKAALQIANHLVRDLGEL